MHYCYHTNTKAVNKLSLSTSNTNHIIIGPTLVTLVEHWWHTGYIAIHCDDIGDTLNNIG